MKLEDFQEFFNLFVIDYLPFKDQPIYQVISNYLLDYYFSNSYQDIPESFKSAYEDQLIPLEFYDSLLLSNGFTEEIVSKLTLNEKYILLQSFMDFNRYKGTLESIRKVSDSFDDLFNIYELYLDYRKEEWVFIPNLVYKNSQLSNALSDKVFSYDEISNKTKHFAISKETAESLRLSGNILLPIKTNLILLDYRGLYNHSELLLLYNSIIVNSFKDFPIILYFTDGQYKTTLKNLYKLWFYIFFKVFNVEFEAVKGTIVSFDSLSESFPFSLDDLITIKKDYDAINSNKSRLLFRETYFEKFKKYVNLDSMTSEDLIANYQLELPASLLSYIDARLVDKASAEKILTELYNSVITWLYSLQSVYDQYREFLNIFVSQLPLLKVSLKDSTSYLLINHLKPYHVEMLLNDYYTTITIQDKFNSIIIDNLYRFNFNLNKYTFAHNSHYILEKLRYHDYSSLSSSIFLDLAFKLVKTYKNEIEHLEKYIFNLNNLVTIQPISNYEKLHIDIGDDSDLVNVINTQISMLNYIVLRYNPKHKAKFVTDTHDKYTFNHNMHWILNSINNYAYSELPTNAHIEMLIRLGAIELIKYNFNYLKTYIINLKQNDVDMINNYSMQYVNMFNIDDLSISDDITLTSINKDNSNLTISDEYTVY